VTPDDSVKTAMAVNGIKRLVGSFRICLDERGLVESVLPLRSTGFADYDRKIIANVYQWRYEPYRIDDQVVPVCTGVTFIYSQH
jgi:hypothetical protein